MLSLVDSRLEDIRPGSLVYPSSSARKSGNGGYILEDVYPGHHIADSEIFPAIVINPRKGILVTPTGLRSIGRYSLVSVMK